MTREEKQKAIDALKISAPIMTITQEEFDDYIQTLNKIMDWLEQEPIIDKIRAEIEQLTITKGGDDYVRKMAELFSLKMKVLQIIDKYKAESEET